MHARETRRPLIENADEPSFRLMDVPRGCQVQITWGNGEEGPAIAFASKRDAELWIARDSGAWLTRLAALSPRRS